MADEVLMHLFFPRPMEPEAFGRAKVLPKNSVVHSKVRLYNDRLLLEG